MEGKICCKCGSKKTLDEFNKDKSRKDGYTYMCKICNRIRTKKYSDVNRGKINKKNKEYRDKNSNKEKLRGKKYRDKNSDIIKTKAKEYRKNNQESETIRQKEYYQENKEKILIRNKEHYQKNKEIDLNRQKEYYLKNKEKIKIYNKKYIKERRNTNSLVKLTHNIRKSISKSFFIKQCHKNSRTEQILGCSYGEFKQFIETKFELWMNWDNYGNPKDGVIEPNKTWDIDHIIPLASAKTEEELLKLNHFSNLQPLCSYVNRFIKRDQLYF
jgi:hypothetical protein